MAEDVKAQEEKKAEAKAFVEEEAVATQHVFGGISTLVKAGRLPLKNDQGEIEAQIFHIAYLKNSDEAPQKRPLMFVFNGGPGSPSVWLHMGALGPMRAPMMDDGSLPPPPYALEENPSSWLDLYDLVFVDPVGTGYSRAKDEKTGEKHWGLKGDLEAMAEFIRLFLVREGRTESPIYLCGESYGTTRCAGLAGLLTDRGILLNGVVLVSVVLNFQTLEFRKGNDLPYALFLPTYAATAAHHGKASADAAERAKQYALGDYWLALAQGSNLQGKGREETAKKLAELTGLSAEYVANSDLRLYIMDFCKELLRGQGMTVGRLDSRIKGIEDTQSGHAQKPESDPSMNILMGPYMSLFQAYVRERLEYKTDLEYSVFSGVKKPWDWGSARDGYPDTSDHLRRAMNKNPYMKVLVCSGIYDLATPFFATEYTLSHMGLAPSLAKNITIKEYPAGHMMYIAKDCLIQLKKDVADWSASV